MVDDRGENARKIC